MSNTVKGCYVLFLRLDEPKRTTVGKLGVVPFQAGYYAYVGSAMGGLESRVRRHLRDHDQKKCHWHIDYLLRWASVDRIVMSGDSQDRKIECELSRTLALVFESVPGFGCSDCRCSSHLYFDQRRDVLLAGILRAFDGAGVKAQALSLPEFVVRKDP